MVGAAGLVGWIRLLPLWAVSYRATDLAHAKARAQCVAASFITGERSPPSGVSERQVDDWIGAHYDWFEHQRQAAATRLESDLTYAAEDGSRHVYLGDFDSYHWLRMARNYLRSGTTCDAGAGPECRDTYANAPVGRTNVYARSLHIAAIVLVNDLATKFKAGYPLAGSAFLVPVVVGMAGVIPAFAIGQALGGNIAGFTAALLSALNPLLLQRTIGSDDDIWNIVLPLFMVWAIIASLQSRSTVRRLACALIAAIFAGLHATTWQGWSYTYLVALAGLAATAVLNVFQYLLTGRSQDGVHAIRRSTTVPAAFYAATGLLTLPPGSAGFTIPLTSAWQLAQRWLEVPPASPAHNQWLLQTLATVAELTPMKLHEIIAAVGGPYYFAAAYAGLLVLFLPKANLRKWHYLILTCGVVIGYWLAFRNPDVTRAGSIALLGIPLCAAILSSLFTDSAAGDSDRAAGLIVAIWFTSALYLSYGGARYAMLLVPSVAIAAAILIGRLYSVLLAMSNRVWPIGVRLATPTLAVAMCALVSPAVIDGYRAARAYEPSMNSAWWDALSKLKSQSPPDSIVFTPWDYGYWTKFVAERRVVADGGSLLTHIPFWFSQALLAPTDRESMGLLRMLGCGSDATALPEEQQGAYGKLIKYGLSQRASREAIFHVASLDSGPAGAYFAQLGLNPDAVADVLRSTHCTPPPSYLVLSSAMPRSGGLWYSERPYSESPQHTNSENMQSSDDLSSALSVGNATRADDTNGNLIDRWRPCIQLSESDLLCRLDNMRVSDQETLELATINTDAPEQCRLRVRVTGASGGAAREQERIPATILMLKPDRILQLQMPSSGESEIGIMVDVAKRRILAGPPYLLRSNFTELLFLDGRYTKAFQKIDERPGTHEERVSTWRINWGQH
jgi:asparagine N-glycosylation enzyme membrane subunit Stt3